MEDSQAQILDYCLKNCIFDGWSTKLLEDASISAGFAKNHWRVFFPNGIQEVIAYFSVTADAKMAECTNLSHLRTHEKIRELIKFRFNSAAKHREATKLALGVMILHPVENLKITYRTMDEIWRLAGDKSTDWNFYSKRILLAGVYGSTLLYWISDESDGFEDSWNFLDKRLAEVGAFGKNISNIKKFLFKELV